jgi:hypothetical protein
LEMVEIGCNCYNNIPGWSMQDRRCASLQLFNESSSKLDRCIWCTIKKRARRKEALNHFISIFTTHHTVQVISNSAWILFAVFQCFLATHPWEPWSDLFHTNIWRNASDRSPENEQMVENVVPRSNAIAVFMSREERSEMTKNGRSKWHREEWMIYESTEKDSTSILIWK